MRILRLAAPLRAMLACVLVLPVLGASPVVGPAGRAFYDAPPLGIGTHGDLIWSRALVGSAALPSAASNDLVLYRTTAVDGHDVAVSGVVSIPKGTPPAGGWPVISWDHGTTGDAPECAPSRDTQDGPEHQYLYVADELLDAYVARGYAVVQTDYEGNGTPGIHPYLVGEAEARDTIDIVRAARQLDPQIGSRYVIAGHSQGGHAALFAAARAATWAPELTALGVVSLAPASHLHAWLSSVATERTPDAGFVFIALLLRGYAATYPGIALDKVLVPAETPFMDAVLHRCAYDLLVGDAWSVPSGTSAFVADPQLGPLLDAATRNEPGALAISIPMLLVQGTGDTLVVPAATDALDREFCAHAATLRYDAVAGADHVGVVSMSASAVSAWIDARFAGTDAPSNCANARVR